MRRVDRYEREINLAQRSSIKRIQEQDSSAAIPLVLCVSDIRWAEPPEAREMNPDEEPLLVIAGLELTDGWYRIRANIDMTLRSAVERGRIVVGCKLAISGARVSSPSRHLSAARWVEPRVDTYQMIARRIQRSKRRSRSAHEILSPFHPPPKFAQSDTLVHSSS